MEFEKDTTTSRYGGRWTFGCVPYSSIEDRVEHDCGIHYLWEDDWTIECWSAYLDFALDVMSSWEGYITDDSPLEYYENGFNLRVVNRYPEHDMQYIIDVIQPYIVQEQLNPAVQQGYLTVEQAEFVRDCFCDIDFFTEINRRGSYNYVYINMGGAMYGG